MTAADAEHGLSLVGAEDFDGVLVDNGLPDLTGVEFIRLLRADPRTLSIPIVLFTGAASAEVERSARLAGADDFLAKPVEPLVLEERVLALLTRQTRTLPTRGLAPSPAHRAFGLITSGDHLRVTTTRHTVTTLTAKARRPTDGAPMRRYPTALSAAAPRRLLRLALAGGLLLGGGSAWADTAPASTIDVVVDGGGDTSASAVVAQGGVVTGRIALLDGVTATIPSDRLSALRAALPSVFITPDVAVTPAVAPAPTSADDTTTSLSSVAALTGASRAHAAGDTGRGIDVALLDSGIAPSAPSRPPARS